MGLPARAHVEEGRAGLDGAGEGRAVRGEGEPPHGGEGPEGLDRVTGAGQLCDDGVPGADMGPVDVLIEPRGEVGRGVGYEGRGFGGGWRHSQQLLHSCRCLHSFGLVRSVQGNLYLRKLEMDHGEPARPKETKGNGAPEAWKRIWRITIDSSLHLSRTALVNTGAHASHEF